MPATSAILEETMTAGRGVLALIVGDRRSADYFDLTDRGLVTSFIALFILLGISALLAMGGPAGSVLHSVVEFLVLFVFQVGCCTFALRQMKRLDGLVPYLVADNWATFFVSIVSMALALVGIGGYFMMVLIGIIAIVVLINIARFIVTLTPGQIAIFVVAQLIGMVLALFALLAIYPLPPELVEALSTNTQPA